jgi:pyridoxine kinase
MNILSIQSHVVYGHVGNAAAVFPLQRLGHEVWPIHTVLFSNHTGYGDHEGTVLDPTVIGACVEGLARRGALEHCDGVLSGYVGSVETGARVVEAAARVKAANPDALYCCDPVIGDVGRGVYVREGVAAFMRKTAVPAADIITPNQFEAEQLTGFPLESMDDVARALKALHALGPALVLITSLMTPDVPEDKLDLIVSDGRLAWALRTPRLPIEAHGAGDCIAALFFGHYLVTRSPAEAMSQAASAVHGVLRRTMIGGGAELALVAAQEEFLRPTQIFVPRVL